MKLKLILLLFCILYAITSYSQISENRYNVNYVSTSLFEDFSSGLNRSVWSPTAHTLKGTGYNENPFIFVDSVSTVHVDSNNSLQLSMLSFPNYTTTDWNNGPISANYISGEINSNQTFSYGIFECNARFANDHGSFPAFWLYSVESCANNHINEIDIAECKVYTSYSRLQYNIFYLPQGCSSKTCHECDDESGIDWDLAHTFKCIWDPYKLSFWIDNTLLKEVTNSNYNWYPNLNMRVILSQQVGTGSVTTPQTSYFNWVKVREFFVSPVINVSDLICSNNGTASLDVDNRASNVSWSLLPSNFFQSTSGTGKNASFTAYSSAKGQATITYTFYMPSGEQFTASKDFWVGQPDYYVRVTDPIGNPVPTNNYGEPVACPNTDYVFSIQNNLNECLASNHSWQVPQEWTVNYNNGYEISINTEDEPYNTMYVDAKDCCYNDISLSLCLENSQNCDSYRLIFAPSPSTTETTMTIEMINSAQKFNESLNWEMEVYDQTQALKLRKTKINGKDQKINTSGWKDGIYLVHVNYDGNDIIGKLSVKK